MKKKINESPFRSSTRKALSFEEYVQNASDKHLVMLASLIVDGAIADGNPLANLTSVSDAERLGRTHFNQFLTGSAESVSSVQLGLRVRMDCSVEQIVNAIREDPYIRLLLEEDDAKLLRNEALFIGRIFWPARRCVAESNCWQGKEPPR